MARAVVDLLETVQVEPDQAEGEVVAGRPRGLLLQQQGHAAPVEQAGEHVDPGQALQLLGALAHLGLQRLGVAGDLVGHVPEVADQLPHLAAAAGQVHLAASLAQGAHGLAQRGHGAQQLAMQHPVEEQQCHQQEGDQQAQRRGEARHRHHLVEVEQGDLEPADAGQVGDAGQVALAIDGDEVGDHAGLLQRGVAQPAHALHHPLAVGGQVEEQVEGALLPLRLDEAGEVDEARVAVELDGAVEVGEQGGDAALVDVDDLLEDVLQGDAGAHHAEDLALGVAHQHVDPQLGDAELHVGVDVEVEVAPLLDQLVEPGIRGAALAQVVAQRVIAEVVLGVVVVVGAVTAQGDEVVAVDEVAPEALHLADRLGAQQGLIRVRRPAPEHLGVGELVGEGDLALQRLQQAGAVVLHLHLGHAAPPLLDDPLRHVLEAEPGQQRGAQHQGRRHQQEAQFQAHGVLLRSPPAPAWPRRGMLPA